MADRPVADYTIGFEQSALISVDLGEDASGFDCAVALRRLPGGRNSYSPLSTVVYVPVVTAFAGDSNFGPGFYVTIEDNAPLKPGVYEATATLTLGGVDAEPIKWLVEASA